MSVIFVGGSQRGGTTLLQTLLCQDRTVNPLIQEAKYFRHLVAAYRFGRGQFDVETKDYFRDLDDYVAFNRSMVRTFLKHTLELFPGRKHLVLREPHLTMLFPELAELLPKAAFLCVVRDPRDVVASMIDVGGKLKQQGASDAMARLFGSRDIPQICAHFLSFYEPLFKSKVPGFRDRLLFLRYEDLVRAPGKQMEALRKFTGLKLQDVDPTAEPDTGRVDHARGSRYQNAWKTEKDGRALSDGSIGRHVEVLKSGEIEEVEKLCGRYMAQFKYKPGPVTGRA